MNNNNMIKKIEIRYYFSFLFWYHGTLNVFKYFVECAVDFPIYLKALMLSQSTWTLLARVSNQ